MIKLYKAVRHDVSRIEKFIIEKGTRIKCIIVSIKIVPQKKVCTLMGLHRYDNIITFVKDACDRVILLYNSKVIKFEVVKNS